LKSEQLLARLAAAQERSKLPTWWHVTARTKS